MRTFDVKSDDIVILNKIVDKKKEQLEHEKKSVSIEAWKQIISRPGIHKPLDFYSSITKEKKTCIIAEIKKASPSKGILKEEYDPEQIAKEYYLCGIDAISVLTERHFFLGSEQHLSKVRQVSPIPILRKDFIIDVWQIYQSRYIGADAILLIAAILNDFELKKFLIVAGMLGLHCIVEVHDREELERALYCGAKIIGINNRNLKTFEVDIKTTEYLIKHIPYGIAVVSESGIKSYEDFKRVHDAGVNAVLIGEAFMTAPGIKNKINEFRGEKQCLLKYAE